LWQDLPRLPGLPAQQAWEGKTGLGASELRAWLRGELGGLEAPLDTAPGLLALAGLAPTAESRWVKGQMAGPMTLALCLKDVEGKPLAERPELLGLLNERLAEAGARQAELLGRGGRRVLLVLDEPAATDVPALEERLRELIAALRAGGIAVGVHSCGKPSWPWLVSLGTDVLNVDAQRYPLETDEDLRVCRGFLESGGQVAWGLVPAVESPPPAAELLELARSSFGRLGPELLRCALLTSSCGLAGLSETGALAVEARLQELSRRLCEGMK
jgi:hypothetical protein